MSKIKKLTADDMLSMEYEFGNGVSDLRKKINEIIAKVNQLDE